MPGIDNLSCSIAPTCVVWAEKTGGVYFFNGRTFTIVPASLKQAIGVSNAMSNAKQPADPACGNSCVPSISCPTLTMCAEVDSGGNADVYDDGAWTPFTQADPACGQSDANCEVFLSCSSASFCEGVDNQGDAFGYQNGSWVTATALIGLHDPEFEDISCTSGDVCFAVDSQFEVDELSDGSWSKEGDLYGVQVNGGSEPPYPESIACASPTFCVAVDNFGSYYNFDGSYWTRAKKFASYQSDVGTVTCTGESHTCVLLDPSNNLYVDTGGAPVAANNGSDKMTAVDCSSPSFCISVDKSGHLFLFRP